MNAIFLLLIILGISTQHISVKAYSTKAKGSYSFSMAKSLVALIVFIVIAGKNLTFSSESIIYSVAFAIAYSLEAIFTVLAIKTGPLSLTSLLGQYSLIIPTFYGLLMLNEKAGLSLIIGIVLLLISLFLINLEGKKEEKKITLKWVIYVALSFIGNGGCSTVQKVQQINCNGAYKSEFMIIALIITVITLFVCTLISEKDVMVDSLKKGFPYYSICGLANGAVNFFVLVLATRMPASVMFPIISAGGIITTALVSIFIYGEKLSLPQKIGMVLGIVAVVVLN